MKQYQTITATIIATASVDILTASVSGETGSAMILDFSDLTF